MYASCSLCDLLSSNCVTQALFDLLISNCHTQARKQVALIQEGREKWSPWPVGEKLCSNTKMRPLVLETWRTKWLWALDHPSPNTCAVSLEMTEIPHGMKQAANEAQHEDNGPKYHAREAHVFGIYWVVQHWNQFLPLAGMISQSIATCEPKETFYMRATKKTHIISSSVSLEWGNISVS